eukprot:CAMPEP_0194274482 /NCGR_PEP_ID=MMETSP0169-20130528/7558_1 /TAXON_ID=218684 /ORGANISM="Corethron pennatum, Strain L29A3" /LENGTH=499 /DNA_ID=CAMNT_0039017687 /DNA_START=89 /DNA_END=1585 /DNA_ORIENTATION=-
MTPDSPGGVSPNSRGSILGSSGGISRQGPSRYMNFGSGISGYGSSSYSIGGPAGIMGGGGGYSVLSSLHTGSVVGMGGVGGSLTESARSRTTADTKCAGGTSAVGGGVSKSCFSPLPSSRVERPTSRGRRAERPVAMSGRAGERRGDENPAPLFGNYPSAPVRRPLFPSEQQGGRAIPGVDRLNALLLQLDGGAASSPSPASPPSPPSPQIRGRAAAWCVAPGSSDDGPANIFEIGGCGAVDRGSGERRTTTLPVPSSALTPSTLGEEPTFKIFGGRELGSALAEKHRATANLFDCDEDDEEEDEDGDEDEDEHVTSAPLEVNVGGLHLQMCDDPLSPRQSKYPPMLEPEERPSAQECSPMSEDASPLKPMHSQADRSCVGPQPNQLEESSYPPSPSSVHRLRRRRRTDVWLSCLLSDGTTDDTIFFKKNQDGSNLPHNASADSHGEAADGNAFPPPAATRESTPRKRNRRLHDWVDARAFQDLLHHHVPTMDDLARPP